VALQAGGLPSEAFLVGEIAHDGPPIFRADGTLNEAESRREFGSGAGRPTRAGRTRLRYGYADRRVREIVEPPFKHR
jgi:hypothetical protein